MAPLPRVSLVNPAEESLEAGLSRELLEELGLEIPITEEDYVETCYAPALSWTAKSKLILHFYVKKMEEEQIREVERAAASTAVDHGLEVERSLRRSALTRALFRPHLLPVPAGHGDGQGSALQNQP